MIIIMSVILIITLLTIIMIIIITVIIKVIIQGYKNTIILLCHLSWVMFHFNQCSNKITDTTF